MALFRRKHVAALFNVFILGAYTPLPDYATIGMFATLYQRVLELRVGTSFLDAGCASGFLPLLIAERIPFVDRIVGIDLNGDAFATAQELAKERSYQNVEYLVADLLSDEFAHQGHFDTVVALHVLEHLTEHDMYRALINLLGATSQRLIVAVPYEEGSPETTYGHLQIFSREKLGMLGKWCIQYLNGAGRMWVEDCVGGLLMIERI